MEDIETLRDFKLFFDKQGNSVVTFVMKQEPWGPHSVKSAWEDLMIWNEQTSGLESALAAVAACASETIPSELEPQPCDTLEEYRLKKLTEHLREFDVNDETIAAVKEEIGSILVFSSFILRER